MSDLIPMQHASKGPAGFSHAGVSVSSDEYGVISIPAHLTGYAQAHGFSATVAEKPAPKPLAKAAKGGAADEAASDDGDKVADGETDSAEVEKPLKKGAKAAKGGAE